MNVLSLFDGISCGQVALERANIKVDSYYASEINKDSIDVTQYNYPNTIQLGDVTKILDEELEKLPRIDLLIGGSPCQDISRNQVNEYNEGIFDSRSGLFFEFIRIRDWLIQNNNPGLLWLLENVKPRKKEYLSVMSEYVGCEPTVIDSALVSAQRRIRYYWTNINSGNIPQPKDKGILIKDVIEDINYKVIEKPEIEHIKERTKNYWKWKPEGSKWYSQGNRAYYLDGKMCTLCKTRCSSNTLVHIGGCRYKHTTPVEFERYQTLPDNYTSIISSSEKRMGLVGDGWTVDVIAHILSFIPDGKHYEGIL